MELTELLVRQELQVQRVTLGQLARPARRVQQARLVPQEDLIRTKETAVAATLRKVIKRSSISLPGSTTPLSVISRFLVTPMAAETRPLVRKLSSLIQSVPTTRPAVRPLF